MTAAFVTIGELDLRILQLSPALGNPAARRADGSHMLIIMEVPMAVQTATLDNHRAGGVLDVIAAAAARHIRFGRVNGANKAAIAIN